MELIRGDVKVEFDYVGEGRSGDYNPDDPDDVPLLRFYISRLTDGEWEYLDRGSYCTMIHADTDITEVAEALGFILETVVRNNFDKVKIAQLSFLRKGW